MKNDKVIQLAFEYAKKYDNNVYSLIKDLDIELHKIDLDELFGFTVNINNRNLIYVNSNSPNYINFIIAHEIGHVILHDSKLREFNKMIDNKNKEELQANLFATMFLGCIYQDCTNDNYIQKIINNIYCNYFTCDVMKLL